MKTKTTTGLKLLLKSHNMNQAQLAEKMGVSQGLVSQWATGKVQMTKQSQNKIIEVIKDKDKNTTTVVNNFVPTPIPTFASKPAFTAMNVPSLITNEHITPVIITKEPTIEKLPKKAVSLEGKIKECKRHCLESYGFEILVVKMKS
jgi:transcriptional regulator with XRE-family HTH domain